MELIFELVIRPSNYRLLIQSDKAYAPSTARYLNLFHLFFESAALLLFIPQFSCVAGGFCGGGRASFGLINASLNAVIGYGEQRPALGRFVIGLSFLRLFGLIRHWKQMWINDTFKGFDDAYTKCELPCRLVLALFVSF